MLKLAPLVGLAVLSSSCNREPEKTAKVEGEAKAQRQDAVEPPVEQTISTVKQPATLSWQSDEKAALARAKRQRKRILVDIGAIWCTPCKELEQITFADPEVIARLQGWVLLRFDVTDQTDADKALMSRYRTTALPAVIVLDPGGDEELRISEFLGPDELLARLDQLP